MTRLLVVRLSALGDIIHTIPAVVSLREAFDVSWVVEKPYAELVEIVAGVRSIPVRLKRWSLSEVLAAREAIRGFDMSVDFQGLMKSALIGRACGARERYGFARDAVREKPAAMFYNRPVTVDQSRHVVDWNLQLASIMGGAGVSTANWSAYPHDPRHRLAEFMNKIVLLPGAGRPSKRWPVARFRELVARYRDRAVVVSGPGEMDLAAAIGGVIAPDTNLRELAFLLQHAQIVVGGDTGPLHLADALGTRVIGLYGPTDPKRNGPHGQAKQTIRRSETMASITAAEVIERIDEAVSR